METLIVQQREIKIDGDAKCDLRWFRGYQRIPRKKKKKMKKKGYNISAMKLCYGIIYNQIEKELDKWHHEHINNSFLPTR